MDELTPLPELSPLQYLLLLVLLVMASSCNPVLGWLFPTLQNTPWLTLLPPLLGIYSLLLLFRNLGIIRLPNAACYSALLAPLSALSFYQFILH